MSHTVLAITEDISKNKVVFLSKTILIVNSMGICVRFGTRG